MFENFANRKCNRPLIENFRWKISIKNGIRPLIEYFRWKIQSKKWATPLISRFQRQQAAEAALNGSSARKASQGEAAKRLTIFAEKNEDY